MTNRMPGNENILYVSSYLHAPDDCQPSGRQHYTDTGAGRTSVYYDYENNILILVQVEASLYHNCANIILIIILFFVQETINP